MANSSPKKSRKTVKKFPNTLPKDISTDCPLERHKVTGVFRTINETELYIPSGSALRMQGRSPEQIMQIMESGSNFSSCPLNKGEKLYAFDTAKDDGSVYKKKGSPYWMSEREYIRLKNKYCTSGVWDQEGVKNELSLPCYNRADTIVQTTVVETHTAVSSQVGPAEDLDYLQTNDGRWIQRYKSMPGGAEQVTPDPRAISDLEILSAGGSP